LFRSARQPEKEWSPSINSKSRLPISGYFIWEIVPVQNLFYPPKEPIAYLKSDQDLFSRRLEGLVRDKGENFRKVLWKVASYLAKEEKGRRKVE